MPSIWDFQALLGAPSSSSPAEGCSVLQKTCVLYVAPDFGQKTHTHWVSPSNN